MPPQGLSTAEVFQHSQIPAKIQTASNLLGALSGGRLATIGSLLTNRLQEAAEKLSPWVLRLADAFNEVQCAGHQLTGSGAAYFGLFGSRGEAIRATRIMKTRLPDSEFYCAPACGLDATLI